ncbi:MAG: hypothetical protein Q4A43_02890 [Coriobacteriia bacterium]|nr:hypothetical protein [Coriobacteriia bacterium]
MSALSVDGRATQVRRDAASRGFEANASARHASSRMSMGAFSEEEERRLEARGNAAHSARSSRAPRQKSETAFGKLTHKMRSAKAERLFERNVPTSDARSSQPEQSSRAALYEMKMGKDHRRSAHMQDDAKSGKSRFSFAGFNPLSLLVGTKGGQWACVAMIAMAFSVFILHQPIADWYNEGRSLQQLQAQYEISSAEYEQVKADVDYLSTDEGLADYAHEQLGWLKSGEHSVNVVGLDGEESQSSTSSSSASTTQSLALASAKAQTPDTWYSGVLDVIFGYEG